MWLPELELAFEYQGKQHYEDTVVIERDLLKIQLCLSKGITLVHVPPTWDREIGTLRDFLSSSGLVVDEPGAFPVDPVYVDAVCEPIVPYRVKWLHKKWRRSNLLAEDFFHLEEYEEVKQVAKVYSVPEAELEIYFERVERVNRLNNVAGVF